ncbi:hypothetical protein [Cohnella cholangitidis]|uniref:Uncharacterized protein n=1 Tax=Cohnella cholangitidis TaxID=2598458 RepID=A0A7G5BSY6_9BACL|nr:hypothetical protein [Cohnella cholangitidis]QMV40070.1 hypothetical protein FPL14_01795 [Cohnella cholangitidis]
MRKLKIVSAIFLAALILSFLAYKILDYELNDELKPSKVAEQLLKENLAELPPSTSGLQVAGGSFMYPNIFIKFHADKEEIKAYVINSKALKNLNLNQTVSISNQDQMNHFQRNKLYEWYDPFVINDGKIYMSSFNRETNHFTKLVIDNIRDTVYIELSGK